MATEQEIKTLLDGRKIVDTYVLAKTDRSDPHWVHPSIEEYAKALEELGFKTINDFLTWDKKLSLLEIVDKIHLENRYTASREVFCDMCVGRGNPNCVEALLEHNLTSAMTCQQVRSSKTIATDNYASDEIITLLGSDPIVDAQKALALEKSKTTGAIFTLDIIIQLWEHIVDESCYCNMRVVQDRDYDFDPWWRLSSMRLRKA
jgi:hypothetical protein